MTGLKGGARPDHIAELTLGAQLPLEPIADAHLNIIFETILQAWGELQINGATVLGHGDEAEVNALLEPRLNHHCQSLPLWKDVVHSVQRGRETMSYNGARLEPRPDVSLVFLHGNRNFPMVVECKIIDSPNKKSINLYCSKGIARFVSGDYAWASRQAIMLGYVRDGSTISNKLAPYLAQKAKLQPDPFQTTSGPRPLPAPHSAVHHSEHARSFKYLSKVDGTGPGPIDLYHVWLIPPKGATFR